MFGVKFVDVYCGSVVEGSYHHLLRSLERSPSTSAVSLQRSAETAGYSQPTAGIVPVTITATCCAATVAPPASVAGQHAHLVPEGRHHGRPSSATDNIVSYHNTSDIQSHMGSPNQVQ